MTIRKAAAIVLAVQAAVFAGAILIYEQSIDMGLAYACIIALLLSVPTSGLHRASPQACFAACGLAIALPGTVHPLAVALPGIAALIFCLFGAAEERDENGTPFWRNFLQGLPLGAGVLCSAALALSRPRKPA